MYWKDVLAVYLASITSNDLYHQEFLLVNRNSHLQSVPFDDSVKHMEWHTHLLYALMTLNNIDEIQQQDLCVVSSIYVEGKLLLEST